MPPGAVPGACSSESLLAADSGMHGPMVGNTLLFLAIPWVLLETTFSHLTAVPGVAVRAVPFLAASLLGPLLDQFDRRRVFFAFEVVQN
jgi:hypothetical protein